MMWCGWFGDVGGCGLYGWLWIVDLHGDVVMGGLMIWVAV